MKEIIDQKVKKGYPLDLGKIIEVSFETYKKTFLLSGVAIIIATIVLSVVYVGYFGILYGFGDFTKTISELQTDTLNPTMQIINAAFGIIFASLLAPLVAGFINVNHLAKTNQEFGIGSFFDYYKSAFLKDLILNQLIIALFLNSIATFLILSNHQFIAMIIQITIPLFTLFCIPLIIYGEQNFMESLVKSIKLFIKNPFIIIISLIIAFFGIMVGIIALCVGILFTFPYYFSMVYAIYEQAIGFKEKSVIDDIGLE